MWLLYYGHGSYVFLDDKPAPKIEAPKGAEGKPGKSGKPAARKPSSRRTNEKVAAVSKALGAKKAATEGYEVKVPRKYRTSVTFKRPRTLRLPKAPKYPRRSVPRRNKLDHFAVLKHPLTTESAMKKIEDHNTLVFVVDIRASKRKILESVKKMYDIKAVSVRTSITYVPFPI